MNLSDVRRVLHAPKPDVPADELRFAAVAAVLDSRLDLLFIKRAEIAGDPWSGHVSFPGGRHHPEDPDAITVAVRETHEEVGLDLGPGELLGQLDDIVTPRALPRMMVRPFVFFVPEFGDLSLEAREVAGTHTYSLPDLQAGHGRSSFAMDWGPDVVNFPCVDFDGVRLWGMTLRVVDDLLDRMDGGNRLSWLTNLPPRGRSS